MTAIHTTTDQRVRPASSTSSLRKVMQLDTAVLAVGGAAMLAAASPIADLIGIDTAGPVRAVGAFFAVLAIAVGVVSRSGDRTLVQLASLSGAGDLVWALASVAVAMGADLSSAGRALIVVQAVAVLAIGEAKLVLAKRAR